MLSQPRPAPDQLKQIFGHGDHREKRENTEGATAKIFVAAGYLISNVSVFSRFSLCSLWSKVLALTRPRAQCALTFRHTSSA